MVAMWQVQALNRAARAEAGGVRWQVTRDWEAERDVAWYAEMGEPLPSWARSSVGVEGPEDANVRLALDTRWRSGDDDGNVVYEGRASGEEGAEAAFDDFCIGMAGCTWVEVWKPGKGGGWQPFIGGRPEKVED